MNTKVSKPVSKSKRGRRPTRIPRVVTDVINTASITKTKDPDMRIFEAVCVAYGIRKGVPALLSKRRPTRLAFPRQVAMHLFRFDRRLSFPNIARRLHLKCHVTVMYGCRKVARLIKKAPWFCKDLATVRKLYRLKAA